MWNFEEYIELDQDDENKIRKLLFGRKVKVDGNNLILDNGIVLEIEANEGCGGCSNGLYSIKQLNEVDNAITNVEFICDDNVIDTEYDETSYKIFVFCEDTRIKLLQIDGDDGNGYYGTGYTIKIKKTKIPKETLEQLLKED